MMTVLYDPILAEEAAYDRMEARYRYTLEHGRCHDCRHCYVCPWDTSVGWCSEAEEFVCPSDAPEEYDCECYEGDMA